MASLLAYTVIVYPSLRSSLWTARRTLRGWKQLTPAHSAVPVSKYLLLAFVHHLTSRKQVAAAVPLAVQWGCYMRGSEVLNFCRHRIALPGDTRVSHFGEKFAGINIKDAKTGPLRFSAIKDHDVLQLLQTYLYDSRFTGSDLVFPISYHMYQNLIKETALFFGISGPFNTHSARIGGAFHDYCMGISGETIAITGRWESLRSLRRYFQNARAWVLEMPKTSFTDQKVAREKSQCSLIVEKCTVYLKAYMWSRHHR